MQPGDSYFDTAEARTIHKPEIKRRLLKDKRTIIAFAGALAIFVVASLILPGVFARKIDQAAAPLPLQHTGFLYTSRACVAWFSLSYFADPNHVPLGTTGVVITFASREAELSHDPMCDNGPQDGSVITGYQSSIHSVTGYYYSYTTKIVAGKAVKVSVYHRVLVQLSEAYSGAIDVNGSAIYSEDTWSNVVTFRAAAITDRNNAYVGLNK